MTKLADVMIGDLLKKANLVNSADVANAVQVATKTGLPIGRVLVMLGLLSNETVQAATDAQTLVRERIISLDCAIRALTVVGAQRVDLERALCITGEYPVLQNALCPLGELLIAADVVTTEQIKEALDSSRHVGLPLGRILILKGMLSQEMVEAALEAQILVRDQLITYEQALKLLQSMSLHNCGIHDALFREGLEDVARRTTLRIGELLCMSELVSEADLLTAIEIGLMEERQIGRILLDFGFIEERLLNAGLTLQRMVNNRRLSVTEASAALKLVANHSMTVVQSVAEVMEPQIRQEDTEGLLTLLRTAGFLTTEEHQRMEKFRGTSIFNMMLAETGLVNEMTLQVAVRCHLLMVEKLITKDQAVVALHHWRWSGISLRDIFHNMGWTQTEERRQRANKRMGDGFITIDAPSWHGGMQLSHSWH